MSVVPQCLIATGRLAPVLVFAQQQSSARQKWCAAEPMPSSPGTTSTGDTTRPAPILAAPILPAIGLPDTGLPATELPDPVFVT